MPNPIQRRILAEAHDPLIARLWRALAGLHSTVTFMNTGAHPDDETSAMLAALWLRDGVNLSYACSTRGEGGQNDIGTEAGPDLGTLRTAEMERAAQVLEMRLYWHGQSACDTISDFRFSKSGVETMGIWGRDRLMQRFVDIVRTDRPDILCPTFLDIPGQHGHHRAMTEAAHDVIALAADPGYAGSDLPVWQVSKLYLPAWSGAGGAYDDEVPPPPATLSVAGKGSDPILGMSYERIGQWSRQFHRTQGMGRWVAAGEERDWPLHLAWSGVGDDRGAVTDNIPGSFADLGLAGAEAAIEATVAAFPDARAVAARAAAAVTALSGADVPEVHAHRVARKLAQLAAVIRIAHGIDARARPNRSLVAPREDVSIVVEARVPTDVQAELTVVPGPGQRVAGAGLDVEADAPPTDPYPDTFDPLFPRAPALAVGLTADGVYTTSTVPFEVPLITLPAPRARLSVSAGIVNLSRTARSFVVSIEDRSPGEAAFDLPDGWRQEWRGSEVTLHLPEAAVPGLHRLSLTIDGEPAYSVRVIDHDHTDLRVNHGPAVLTLRLLEVAVPEGRVGYIGAGNDRAAHWLEVAGVDVVMLDDATLAGPAPFEGIDTVLVGVFAHRFRTALSPVVGALNDWVRDGGTMVTLYHRPWDDWDPDTTPPARLQIGQPSLRWRVTDANATVDVLAPEHPAFTTPNRIESTDWDGWQKERGLYFAKAWDDTYTPLVRMADPDEAPLDGGLLVGEIGQGRHVHVALNLHHQMGQLVPGAYRLMANLLSPRDRG